MNPATRIGCSRNKPFVTASAAISSWPVIARLVLMCFVAIVGAGAHTALASHTQWTDTAPAACGLPASGLVFHGNTYTLTADCTQTGTLQLHGDIVLDPNGSTVTIDGKGYTIDATALSNDKPVIQCFSTTTLIIKDLTLRGGGRFGSGALWFGICDATLTNVTITETNPVAIFAGSSSTGGTIALNSVLVENVRGRYSFYQNKAAVINGRNGATFNINRLVMRDVFGGNVAIGNSYGRTSDATFNFSGCYTAERIYPAELGSGISPGSLSKCSGTIGNGGQAVKPNPEPQPTACGLPAGGVLQASASYTLSATCTLTDEIYIPKGLTVTVQGNWNHIRPAAGKSVFETAGNLTVRNVLFENGTAPPINGYHRSSLLIENAIFQNFTRPMYLRDQTATLKNVLWEKNAVTWSYGNAIIAIDQAAVTIHDSTFRNNSGGVSAFFLGWKSSLGTAAVTLEGCASFLNNSPDAKYTIRNTEGTFTDNSTGACPAYTYPGAGDAETPVPRQPTKVATALPPGVEAPVSVGGGMAQIYRRDAGGATIMQVYGISEQSTGYHLLTVSQAQVDALGEGVVAMTDDCRARVTVAANGDVTASEGPNQDGKLLHTVFEGGVKGRVISTYTTFGDSLCPDGAAASSAGPQTSSLQNCMVTTTHFLNFRDGPGGNVIGAVPYNATLTALERTDSWFKVDYHGAQGWISADYVTTSGACA